LTQQFEDFEVVVSDNHCTDGTSKYLAGVRDPRLRVVQPPEHLHVALNHNFCADQSCGRYLTFLASDNVLDPAYAARMTHRLDHEPGAAFAYCAAEFIDGEGKRIRVERHVGGSWRRTGDEALKRFLRGSRCTFDGLLMRRECYEASGGLGLLRAGAYFKELPDWDLDLRLAMTGDVVYLDEILVQFRFWSAENREQNARRLPRYVEEIGRMFDTTVNEMLVQRPQLRGAALKARKSLALNCALGAGEIFGLESYPECERNVRRIHDSFLIRSVLALHHLRLTPVLNAARAAKLSLRAQIKEALYSR